MTNFLWWLTTVAVVWLAVIVAVLAITALLLCFWGWVMGILHRR